MAEAATKPSTEVEVVSLTDKQVEQALRGELSAEGITIEIADPHAIQLQIIARILESEDADAVFQGRKAVGGKDVLDRPFTVKDVTWHKSAFTEGEGLPVFCVIHADMLDDGEQIAITSGAANVMAQVFALNKLGQLRNEKMKFAEAEKPTAAGYRPQWLVRA